MNSNVDSSHVFNPSTLYDLILPLLMLNVSFKIEYIREGSKLDQFLVELGESYQKMEQKYEKNGDEKNAEKYKILNEKLNEFRKETVISEEEFIQKKNEL